MTTQKHQRSTLSLADKSIIYAAIVFHKVFHTYQQYTEKQPLPYRFLAEANTEKQPLPYQKMHTDNKVYNKAIIIKRYNKDIRSDNNYNLYKISFIYRARARAKLFVSK